jgi:truncated hemoglobin YjbI
VDEPTLYERLGGEVGAEAVVRALHERVQNDPDIADLLDRRTGAERHAGDARALAELLGGPSSGVAPEPDGLLSNPAVVERHLRDALWLLGVSTALATEIVAAVLA